MDGRRTFLLTDQIHMKENSFDLVMNLNPFMIDFDKHNFNILV